MFDFGFRQSRVVGKAGFSTPGDFKARIHGTSEAADSLFTADHGKLGGKRWTKLHRRLICGE